MAHLFGRTLREAPADVELISHQLMVRAGMVRPVGAGIHSLLPLGWRVVRKVEQIIREEMDAIGGQEMLMLSFSQLISGRNLNAITSSVQN